MDFSYSDEQTLLKDSVERFVRNDYPFEARRGITASEAGFSRDHWNTFAELGWLGVPFPEALGGFGGGAVDVAIVMEQFGTGLVVEPYLATVVMAGGALRLGGDDQQRAARIPGIVNGSLQGALAYAEPQSRFNLADVRTEAAPGDGGFVLRGQKAVVLNGPAADFFVVSARTAGEPKDGDGIGLFVVDAQAQGVTRRDYRTVDGQRASELILDAVHVPSGGVLGDPGTGLPILEAVIDEAIVAIGAEAVGCMEVAYKTTVEYCKTREQFGQPIGKFQVLAHRMVDMLMEYEQAKSLMYMAAMRLDDGYGAAAKKAVSGFKAGLGRAARFVGQSAVQLHGGMGMTDELAIGHYFKRLTIIETMFGNVDHHLARFGKL